MKEELNEEPKAEQEGSGRAMLVERRMGMTGGCGMQKEGSLPRRGTHLHFGKEVGPIAVTKPKEPDGDDRLRNGDGTTDELGETYGFPTKRKTCLDGGLP
jgi:hypothetical protein